METWKGCADAVWFWFRQNLFLFGVKVCHSQIGRNSIVYLAKEILVLEQADVTVMQIPLSCQSSHHVESWFPTQQSNVTQNMKLNTLGFALGPAHSVVNRTEHQQTECLLAGANRRNDSKFEHCARWLHDVTLVCDVRKIKAYGGMSG